MQTQEKITFTSGELKASLYHFKFTCEIIPGVSYPAHMWVEIFKNLSEKDFFFDTVLNAIYNTIMETGYNIKYLKVTIESPDCWGNLTMTKETTDKKLVE